MASALDLAGELRRLPAAELDARLRERLIARPASIKDAFDLADALLDRSSLRDVVSRLDRVALLTLRTAAEPVTPQELPSKAAPRFDSSPDDFGRSVDRLTALFLLAASDGRDGSLSTYPAVLDALDDDPALTRLALADSLPPVVLETVAPLDRDAHDAASAERLFGVVAEVSELIRAVDAAPARQLARGGLALPEARRLAEAARIDLDDVAPLLAAARTAGLVEVGPDGWAPAAPADAWLVADWADRWSALVGAWLATLPPEIRTVLDQRSRASWGEPLRTFSAWYFPAGGAWVAERLDAFAHAADLFGLTVAGRPTSAATTLLGEGAEAAAELVRSLLPTPITTVYLQHDLTAVAPGPLAPELDARLRRIADVESAGLAATYRISESRIGEALAGGETVAGLAEFLRSLSSTGMPQPVEYLLTSTGERHGRYRVADLGPLDIDERARELRAVSVITSVDPSLLDTVAADQALAPLALVRADADRLLSRFNAETLYWALSDERYPVVYIGPGGTPTRVPARQRARRPAPLSASDPIADLVERVVAGAGDDDTDRAWIVRQLDAAVKARLAVVVTVALADGGSSELTIEPTGVGGGRLRGRDRRADIERTLPLSSIVAVSSPDAPA